MEYHRDSLNLLNRAIKLLPRLGVLCLDRFLLGAPPWLIGLVPVDGIMQSGRKVLEVWLPARFGNQL